MSAPPSCSNSMRPSNLVMSTLLPPSLRRLLTLAALSAASVTLRAGTRLLLCGRHRRDPAEVQGRHRRQGQQAGAVDPRRASRQGAPRQLRRRVRPRPKGPALRSGRRIRQGDRAHGTRRPPLGLQDPDLLRGPAEQGTLFLPLPALLPGSEQHQESHPDRHVLRQGPKGHGALVRTGPAEQCGRPDVLRAASDQQGPP